MAVTITSPKDAYQQNVGNITWQSSNPGQYAFEIQYALKPSTNFISSGIIHSAATSYSIASLYELIRKDFSEIYYRVVVYCSFNNSAGSASTIETSQTHILMFHKGIVAALNIFDGETKNIYPIFSEVDGDVKTMEAIVNNGVDLIPLVESSHPLAGKAKIKTSDGVRHFAKDTATLVPSGISKKGYVIQYTYQYENRYAYKPEPNTYASYANYRKYEYIYSYTNLYTYKPVYSTIGVYGYYYYKYNVYGATYVKDTYTRYYKQTHYYPVYYTYKYQYYDELNIDIHSGYAPPHWSPSQGYFWPYYGYAYRIMGRYYFDVLYYDPHFYAHGYMHPVYYTTFSNTYNYQYYSYYTYTDYYYKYNGIGITGYNYKYGGRYFTGSYRYYIDHYTPYIYGIYANYAYKTEVTGYNTYISTYKYVSYLSYVADLSYAYNYQYYS